MKYSNIREEELKNKIAQDLFANYDCTRIVGNIDFCVSPKTTPTSVIELFEQESFFWAEAKKGNSNIIDSIVQLLLTIGKARTFDKYMPPTFIGAFDYEKIAFIHYSDIYDLFYQNDFNWNVTPSNRASNEFKQLRERVELTLTNNSLIFNYNSDALELMGFIKSNLISGKSAASRIQIDKTNFISIYNKWLVMVKPTIAVNWEVAKKSGLIDGDFYIADLLSSDNVSLKEKLFVLLRKDHYELDRYIDESGLFSLKTSMFKDNMVAHRNFWNRYDRPPQEIYWDYIVERRDLLVPQDIRERKGSFFTPQIWVELSQKYIAEVLGQDWQDEYYVWDCAAGTGNLLNGLTNKYHIWASTIDKQDVDVMKDRIKNGANLLENHIFQFDFLNDDVEKLPQKLKEILNDPQRQKKVIIYINPPYAEHGNTKTIDSDGKHKAQVATTSKVYAEFNARVGSATRELYIQFFLRIASKWPQVKLASFSTLKEINAQNFELFRQYFKASFRKGFICNSSTFDNVNGKFPIGFLFWDLAVKEGIKSVEVDIAYTNSQKNDSWIEGQKTFYAYSKNQFISAWLRQFYDKTGEVIGYLILPGVDMQQQDRVYITSKPTPSDVKQHKLTHITAQNLLEMSIYLAVRHAIQGTWVNHRDQFLVPNDGWLTDPEFKSDCLAFTLFSDRNKVKSGDGINHWIPFSEKEVNAREKFASNFMSLYLRGKLPLKKNSHLFPNEGQPPLTFTFSPEANELFNFGKDLWTYYHQQPGCQVDASLYDIREYFQGRQNPGGKMNSNSDDPIYMELLDLMRQQLKILAQKIAKKVYFYGFLR